VTIPGQTALPENQKNRAQRDLTRSDLDTEGAPKWQLEARLWSGDPDIVLTNRDRWTAYLDEDRLGAHLKLRRRRPGDRFQPLGMGGREVKVADLMINAKIPRRWRRYVPLLIHDQPGGTHKEGIAWVVGWRIDERVKITRDTRRVIRLRWFRCPTIAAPDH
jgi:tRNA(Ile)-lysidine synthase